MSLDKNVRCYIGTEEEEALVDLSGRKLTPRGIAQVEEGLSFGRLVRECPPMAIEFYNQMHPAARAYVDREYFIEMTGFRQNKFMRQFFNEQDGK